MISLDWIYLLVSGAWIGVLSGLLGVGGGLMLVPALVYWAPWWLGHPVLSLPEATGISAVQGLAGTGAAAWVYWRQALVARPYVKVMLPGAMGGALVGGLASGQVPASALAVLLMVVLGMTLGLGLRSYRKKYGQPDAVSLVPERIPLEAAPLTGRRLYDALGASLLVGGLSGLLGIGGAVFLLPLLFDGFGLPVKQAIGTVAVIVWATSLGSVVGKGTSGLIPWEAALAVSLVALIGGWLGAKWQHRVSDQKLRQLHLALIALALLEVFRKTMLG